MCICSRVCVRVCSLVSLLLANSQTFLRRHGRDDGINVRNRGNRRENRFRRSSSSRRLEDSLIGIRWRDIFRVVRRFGEFAPWCPVGMIDWSEVIFKFDRESISLTSSLEKAVMFEVLVWFGLHLALGLSFVWFGLWFRFGLG